MFKRVLMTAAVLSMGVASAATTTATTAKGTSTTSTAESGLYSHLKENLGFTYYTAVSTSNIDRATDFSQANIFTLSYKAKYNGMDLGKLRSGYRVDFAKNGGTDAEKSYEAYYFSYSKGILNQTDHGFSLSATAQARFYSEGERRAAGADGYTYAALIASKSLTNGLSFSQYGYLYQYVHNDNKSAKNTDKFVRGLTFVNYSITDKISVGSYLDYGKYIRRNASSTSSNNYEFLSAYLTAGYSITDKVYLGFEMGSGLMKSNDDRVFKSTEDISKGLIYKLSMNVVAF